MGWERQWSKPWSVVDTTDKPETPFCFGKLTCRVVLFSHPVMSNSLWAQGLQQARPPCLSLSPKICPSSCPLHQWCQQAISSSDTLFSFCPQSCPATGTFPMSQLCTSGDQNTGISASASVLLMSIQGWFPIRLTGLISLLSKGLSGVFSSTTVRRHQFLVLCLLYRIGITTVRDHWEDHRLDLCQQSDIFAFQHTVWVCHSFPAKKQLPSDFMAAVTIHSDFRAQ